MLSVVIQNIVVLSHIMPTVLMLNVVVLKLFLLSVIMLTVALLNVVAPLRHQSYK